MPARRGASSGGGARKASSIGAGKGGQADSAARAQMASNCRVKASDHFGKVWRPKHANSVLKEQNKSGTVRYRVAIGYSKSGSQVKISFGEKKADAFAFLDEWNRLVENNDKLGFDNLQAVASYDLKWCLEQVARANSTLRQAVQFYLNHAIPEAGYLNWEQAVEKYYEIQKAKNLNAASSSKKHKNHRTYYVPLMKFFGKKSLIETTWEDVKKYLDARGKNWGEQTYNNHLNAGRRIWNVLADQKYCSAEINPFEQVPRKKRKVRRGHKKIMHPREVRSFFRFVEQQAKIDTTKYQELALMTLTFFCGVRTTEVSRCDWRQIKKTHTPMEEDETNWTITVWADQEKNSIDKVNPIPRNAKYWLAECQKNRIKGRDQIVSDNYESRMKKLRGEFIKAMKDNFHWPVTVPQNTSRHCFASYHLGMYNDYPLTVARLKHGNVSTLKQNYEATVQPRNAVEYFKIVPESVYKRQEELKEIDRVSGWEQYGIHDVNNQKYIEQLIKAVQQRFIKQMVKLGVPEVEAEENAINGNPIRADQKSYVFHDQEVINVFVHEIEGQQKFVCENDSPKQKDVSTEHLKLFDAENFSIGPDTF